MNNNLYNYNLLEFGGNGSLIATAITDFEANSQYYKKDDVVFSLSNVKINFNYGSTNSNIKNNRNLLYYSEYYLDSFTIDVAPFDLKTQCLFSNQVYNKKIDLTLEEEIVSVGKALLPLRTLSSEDVKIPGIKNYQIHTKNGVSIITSEEFVDGQFYKIQYQTTQQGFCLELDNSELNIPYLKTQIHFYGNGDKNTKESYILVDKASVKMTPVFNLMDNSVSHIRLFFKVIDSEIKPQLWLC